jgi:hypothetical protein
MELIVIFTVLVALDIAPLRWDSNSNNGFDSLEWQRRQRWFGFH